MGAPYGWTGTGDADEKPCDECGCYGGHNPTCSHEVAPVLYLDAAGWAKLEDTYHPGKDSRYTK